MKKRIFLILMVSVITSAFVLVKSWKADTANSSVKFEMPGLYKTGNFSGLKANIGFDTNNLATSKINASIDVNTIHTGEEKKDNHLKSPEFFDAEKFPLISFISTEITKTETNYMAKGKLTIKDSTKIIEIPFSYTQNDRTKAIFKGTMKINAAEYGVMRANKPGADQVIVFLEVPVTKED